MKPVIGITANKMTVNNSGEVAAMTTDYSPRYFSKAIEAAGGIPLLIPITDEDYAKEYLSIVDGLLLTGGEDVSPYLYGEEPRSAMGPIAPDRDEQELALINQAIKQKVPILGVCRGMQLINVYYGGTLYQDLSEDPTITIQHLQRSLPQIPTHDIKIKPDSHLARIIGESHRVNSYHHQLIKDLGEKLTVTAKSMDKAIEAIEANEDNVIAVQWHPELTWREDSKSSNLFSDLIKRASEYKQYK